LPEHELLKTKALVEKFEARLRAQARPKNGNGEGQGTAITRETTSESMPKG